MLRKRVSARVELVCMQHLRLSCMYAVPAQTQREVFPGGLQMQPVHDGMDGAEDLSVVGLAA